MCMACMKAWYVCTVFMYMKSVCMISKMYLCIQGMNPWLHACIMCMYMVCIYCVYVCIMYITYVVCVCICFVYTL